MHPLWVFCGNVQPPGDGPCASPWPPQCRNAATPAGLTAEPAGPAGNKEGRATSPTVTWHSWQLNQCPCEGFYQHLVRGGNGNPERGGCQNPWVQFSVNSRASRSCRQNNAPYCSGQNRNPDLSVSAAPQLPRLLAFPLGDSSRKRSSIAPVRGQWPWCGTELHRQFLAFDSRRRKTSKSLKERTLHLNCQNCLPKVQETEKVFVE